ncbi:unnamed protein product, partial [Didymodactylos carnosus]
MGEDGIFEDDYGSFGYDKWLVGYETSEEIELIKSKVAGEKGLAQTSVARTLYRKLLGGWSDQDVREQLNSAIDKHVTVAHSQYEKCMSLAAQAFTKEQPEPLLRLYTLETPFYGALANDTLPLATPLFKSLDKLQCRYYQGVSFRGLRMTNANLHAYKWAWKNKGAILTRTFSSTSLDQRVAEMFLGPRTDERWCVLMIFHFKQKCDTAINLGRLSAELPCMSEYEHEEEVLLLPWTLFTVSQIEKESDKIIIHLQNIPVDMSLWSGVNLIHERYKR